MKRAKETKEIVTATLEAQQHEIHDLRECCGTVWTTMTALGRKAFDQATEEVSSFMQQVRQGVNQALSLPTPVLIVAHGGVYWALCCLMNLDEEQEWCIDNCLPVHFY